MSETCRCPWREVWEMTALEWLNLLAYRHDKSEAERAEMELWKKTH